MNTTKGILKRQLQLLADRSVHANDSDLVAVTEQMIKLAVILEPEIQSELYPVAPLPLSERLTAADTEALAIGRRELARRQIAEAQQSWNDLAVKLNQQQEENLQSQPK